MITTSKDKINNLQIIRAAAALFVVYFHAGYSFAGLKPFGSFGVDIFFVLSGFIIAGICARNNHAFFRRRLVRILPPYWFFTILVFCIAAIIPSLVKATEPNFSHLFKSLLFVPFRKSNGLLQPTLFLGWTLNYEMFFYCVVAASLAINRKHAMIISSIIIILCIFICSVLKELSDITKFYSNLIMLEFVLGIICFNFYKFIKIDLKNSLAINGFCIIASSVLLISLQAFGVQGDRVWFGIISFSLILSAALLSKNGVDAKSGLFVLIGDASYILYLVHPYIELGISKLVNRRLPYFSPNASIVGASTSIIVSIIISINIHLHLELPMLTFLSRKLIPSQNRDKRLLNRNDGVME